MTKLIFHNKQKKFLQMNILKMQWKKQAKNMNR